MGHIFYFLCITYWILETLLSSKGKSNNGCHIVSWSRITPLSIALPPTQDTWHEYFHDTFDMQSCSDLAGVPCRCSDLQVLLTCTAANSLDIMTATTLRIALSITKALSTMHPTCMFVIVLDTAAPVTSFSTVTSCTNRCRVKRNTGHWCYTSTWFAVPFTNSW